MCKQIKEIAADVAELVERKNKDYDKAFEKDIAKYGPMAYSMMMDHKMNRFFSLAVKGNCQQVTEEKITDTVKDIIGYSLLLLQLMENEEETNDTYK